MSGQTTTLIRLKRSGDGLGLRRIQKNWRLALLLLLLHLVDLLAGVAQKYGLGSDTLFLAVNYIDRFLSTRKVAANKLQLLGLTCMLVASKYEGPRPPRVEELFSINPKFTKDEVVHMEIEVLKTLKYEMGNPTTKTFLQMFVNRAAQEENEDSVLSKLLFKPLCDCFAELSLMDYYSCVGYIPSIVAASVIFLARFTMQPWSHPWTPALQKHTGYGAFELKGCILRLHNLLCTSDTSATGVRPKYVDRCFKFPYMGPQPVIPAANSSCCSDSQAEKPLRLRQNPIISSSIFTPETD